MFSFQTTSSRLPLRSVVQHRAHAARVVVRQYQATETAKEKAALLLAVPAVPDVLIEQIAQSVAAVQQAEWETKFRKAFKR